MRSKIFDNVLGRLWRFFIIVILVAQIATVGAFLNFGLNPVSQTIGILSAALVDATDVVLRTNDPKLGQLFAKRLQDHTGIQVLYGENRTLMQPVPLNSFTRPGLSRISKTLDSILGSDVSLVHRPSPDNKVWVHRYSQPNFSLGIPYLSSGVITKIALGLLLMIMMLGLATSFWLSTRLIRPLAHLAHSARRLLQQKAVRVEVPQHALPELRELADAMNQVQIDLGQLLKDREVFLAGVSHDLRMPLSRLQLVVEMFPQLTPDIQGARDDIAEMSSILEQLVELARLDLERSEPWQVGDINSVLTGIRDKFRRSGLILKLEMQILPDVRFKPIALHRLLYNLIDNGWRHGSGEVRVQTFQQSQRPVILIQNDGCQDSSGSPMQPAVVMSAGGSSGLGLAIVDRLLEVNGIEIRTKDLPGGGREVCLLLEPNQRG